MLAVAVSKYVLFTDSGLREEWRSAEFANGPLSAPHPLLLNSSERVLVLPIPGALVLLDASDGEVLGGARVGFPYAYLGFSYQGSNVTLLLFREPRDPLAGRYVITYRVDYGGGSWYNFSIEVPPDSRAVATDWGVWVPGFPGIQLYSYTSKLLGAVALNSSPRDLGGIVAYTMGDYTVLGVLLLSEGPLTLIVDRGLNVLATLNCTPADSKEAFGDILVLCASWMNGSLYNVEIYKFDGETATKYGSFVISSDTPPALSLLQVEGRVLVAALVSSGDTDLLEVVDPSTGAILDSVVLGDLGFIAGDVEWDPYTGLRSFELDGDPEPEIVVTVVEATLSPITHVIVFEYS
ncbi:MAG: hypothetical protein F7C07_06835 [Desulfurococcales archaeon]|nr:hypothetical protein [Desulfurococcales archaeon]